MTRIYRVIDAEVMEKIRKEKEFEKEFEIKSFDITSNYIKLFDDKNNEICVSPDDPILQNNYFNLANSSTGLSMELLNLIFYNNYNITAENLVKYVPILESLNLKDKARKCYIKLFMLVPFIDDFVVTDELIGQIDNYFTSVNDIELMPDKIAYNFIRNKLNELNELSELDMSKLMDITCENNLLCTIDLLLENTKKKCKSMPIYKIASKGHLDVLKKLDENGYDFSDKDYALLCSICYLDVVKYLIGKDIDNKSINDALRDAAFNGFKDTTNYLLGIGKNITLAIEGASIGNLDMVIYLLEEHNGAKYISDKALMNACINGQFDIVKLLIANGANVSSQRNNAIKLVSRKGYTNIIKILLENGADIHVDNEEPLRMSLFKSHYETSIELLENGADILLINKSLVVEALSNSSKFVDYFLNKNYDTNFDLNFNEMLLNAYKHNWFDIVKLLVDKGANVHVCDNVKLNKTIPFKIEDENTKNQDMLIMYLRDKGADIPEPVKQECIIL
jgi:ankyrin repeat protein